MDQATLKADIRSRTGKGSARQSRREGKIPAVVYSSFAEPTPISVDPALLRKTVLDSDHGFNTVLTLDMDGSTKLAMLKDWQVDPVSRQLLHADFLEIKMDAPIDVSVPLELTGKPIGVVDGGLLSQIRRTLDVRCLPKDIPVRIEADVTELRMNRSLHVAEVTPPEGVEIVFQKNYTIATVTPPEGELSAAEVAAAGTAAPTPGAAQPAAD